MQAKAEKMPTVTYTAPRSRPSAGMAVLVLVSLLVAGYVMWAFAAALLLGGALAMSVYPVFDKLRRLFGDRRRLASGVCTAALALLMLAPLAGLAAFLHGEVAGGLDYVHETLGINSVSDVAHAEVPPELEQRAQAALQTLHVPTEAVRDYAGRAVSALKPVASALAQTSAGLPIYAGLMLLAFFFFLADGQQIPALLRDLSPMRHPQTDELLNDMRDMTRAAILGSSVTAVAQCLAVTLGLVVAGVPHGIFFGLLALPASFIPVAGSALIWVPAAALLAATSHLPQALGLTAWCMAIAALNTHVLKPSVVGNKVSMHPALVFLSILGGIKAFGMIGLVAGPVAMAAMWTLVRIYRRDVAVA